MPVNIRHPIVVIRQPQGSNLCWAAAIAMVLGDGTTAPQVVQRAISAGRTVNRDGSMPSLSPTNASFMALTFRLRMTDVSNTDLTVRLLTPLMRPGRIAILGSFSYPWASGQASLHAVCAFSLVGGGGDNDTRLGYADPYRQDTAERILSQLLDDFLTYPHYIFHR